MRNNKDNMYTGTNIKKSELEFNKTNYIDKSLKNWEEIKNNFFQHIQNQEIIKKLEKEKLNKRYLNEQRKYYYGQHRIKGMPYYYDISSTYMNNYKNKSEHKRHEILIEELSKLRSYLQEYPNNNNVEIIKDFLITHNIENVDKYTNYQLIQVGKFVCQNDIYKINSLLKPYMNVKNMIYDILENSVTLNNKFSGIKFSDSTDKLLNKINLKYKNNRTLDLENSKLSSRNYSTFEKNKKFYISELDYNNDKTESLINNINRIIEQDNENNNINKTNEIKGEEDNKKEDFRSKEEKDFIAYSKKRKQLLDSIGISIKNSNENNFIKEMYSSPLLKNYKNPIKNDFEIYNDEHKINNKKKVNIIKLPKIKNKTLSYYKPNKLLLAPDKNYSSNFDLLLKDINGELKNFEYLYKQQFDMAIKRNSSIDNNNNYQNKNNNNKKSIIHSRSKSCQNLDKNDENIRKKIEGLNRLYYGKANIKIELSDIQKNNKLTEYIALANAKKHINNEIIKKMDIV